MDADVVVIGAGIAGLTCAGELVRGGRSVVVLEKSRGVGGRCATRRIHDRPVDFGVAFYHGRNPEFLDALGRVPDARIEGWPRRVRGRGRPCQPHALESGERRLAFRSGVSQFPKQLALGLDVRTRTRVHSIEPQRTAIRLQTGDDSSFISTDVVVTLPAFQTADLLGALAATSHDARSVLALIAEVPELPCLTLIAGYGAGVTAPRWDAWYPEASDMIQLMVVDSSKREGESPPVLVLQAQAGWSRSAWEMDDDEWLEIMLNEAAQLVGDWVTEPEWTDTHRWRHARTDRSSELARPILFPAGAGRIGLAGEMLSPGCGVQAAWTSGRDLALRMLEEA